MIKLPEAANHILLTAIDAVKPDQLIKQKISVQDDILKVEDRQFNLNQCPASLQPSGARHHYPAPGRGGEIEEMLSVP